jgi:hypothetical protein
MLYESIKGFGSFKRFASGSPLTLVKKYLFQRTSDKVIIHPTGKPVQRLGLRDGDRITTAKDQISRWVLYLLLNMFNPFSL